jgi:hypothetical protein
MKQANSNTRGRTRTGTALRPGDFKSRASTISPPGCDSLHFACPEHRGAWAHRRSAIREHLRHDRSRRAATGFAVIEHAHALLGTRGRAVHRSEGHVNVQAGNGTRTRDPNLGKVVLYQLSYSRNSVEVMKLRTRVQVGASVRIGRQRSS